MCANWKRWKDNLRSDDCLLIISKYYGCGGCPANPYCPVFDCGNALECEAYLRKWMKVGARRGRPPNIKPDVESPPADGGGDSPVSSDAPTFKALGKFLKITSQQKGGTPMAV